MTVRVYNDTTTNHDTYTNAVSVTMVDNGRCAVCQQNGNTITTNIVDVGNHIEVTII